MEYSGYVLQVSCHIPPISGFNRRCPTLMKFERICLPTLVLAERNVNWIWTFAALWTEIFSQRVDEVVRQPREIGADALASFRLWRVNRYLCDMHLWGNLNQLTIFSDALGLELVMADANALSCLPTRPDLAHFHRLRLCDRFLSKKNGGWRKKNVRHFSQRREGTDGSSGSKGNVSPCDSTLIP